MPSDTRWPVSLAEHYTELRAQQAVELRDGRRVLTDPSAYINDTLLPHVEAYCTMLLTPPARFKLRREAQESLTALLWWVQLLILSQSKSDAGPALCEVHTAVLT